jgi:hypothetical protein
MLKNIKDEFMLPNSMSFYAIGKAEKKLYHNRAVIYRQTFWVPKRYERKDDHPFRSW